MQAQGIAGLIGAKQHVALIAVADDNSAAFEDRLSHVLEDSKGELVLSEPVKAEATDVASIVTAVTKAKPDAVVLNLPSSSRATTIALVTALGAANLGGAKLYINGESVADYSADAPPGSFDKVRGLIEGAEPTPAFMAKVHESDPTVTQYRYAAEAYDATVLAALAATVAGDDSAASIAYYLESVSGGGVPCKSFAECLDVLKSESDIDYQGISGPVGFDGVGDVTAAVFGVYAYGADNVATRTSSLDVP
jgi:branched-chain amino acid transport system substrate-binding protein